MFPTYDILTATYHIRVGNGCGTAFCVSKNGRFYFVTAKHMFDDTMSSNLQKSVELFEVINRTDDTVMRLSGFNVHLGSKGVDVAVFEVPSSDCLYGIDYSHLTMTNLILGGQVLLVGFPFVFNYGYKMGNPDGQHPFYLPIVKSGIISTFENVERTSFLVDAHNNAGFSGGPVILRSDKNGSFICGVICGFINDEYDKKPEGAINSGFAKVCPIHHVVNLIDYIDVTCKPGGEPVLL